MVLSALLVDHFVAEGVPVAVVEGVPVPLLMLLMVTMVMMLLLLLISMVELMLVVVVVLMVRVALLLVALRFYNFSQLELDFLVRVIKNSSLAQIGQRRRCETSGADSGFHYRVIHLDVDVG